MHFGIVCERLSYSPTIYSFYPNVSPGHKIVERPSPSLVFYPVSRNEINSMRVWLTDQNNNSIDLRGEAGEQITVRICIEDCEECQTRYRSKPSRL